MFALLKRGSEYSIKLLLGVNIRANIFGEAKHYDQPRGGGHGGLRYCGSGLFFMRYFGNFNFNVCGIRFFIILADGIR